MTEDTLKKRQRLLDNDRLKYQQAAQAQMSKQQESISNLRKENERMKQELAASTGGSIDFAEQDKLATLQSEVDAFERKVQYEKLRRNDLVKKHSIAKMDMMKSRKSMGGVNVTKENTQLIEKQVTVLENRLDQALVKFNEALAHNKKLREQIDNLREERKVFQTIYKKLESDLHEKKKAMADMIERANQDYEERDSLQQQLEALKQAAKEDQKKYEENFASIEAAMQQFKNAREQQLQQQHQQQLSTTKQTNNSTKNENANSNSQQNPGTPEKHGKKNLNATSDSKQMDGSDNANQETEADLQEVVDQLKEATGIQDLDVLYHKFVKAEEHNFSMYNFVNELSTEQESIETEIAQLKEQLHGEKGDVQRRKLLKELENELAQTEQTYERLQSETSKHKETLFGVRNVTQEIFARVGCNPEQARETLGTTEVTELNLLGFLGIIEQRTNEVLFAFNNAAQNEQRRRTQSKDEESRKRKERKAAERQARIEAGEHVPEEDDNEEHEEEASFADGDAVRSRFIGVGPSVGHNQVNAQQLVKQHGLPNTNAGDAQADNTDDVEEDNILSHEQLRQQMELRLQQKREKEERGGKSKKKGDRDRKAGQKA